MSIKEIIEKYNPYDEFEKKDKEEMLYFINNFEDVLTRNNVIGHFSAAGFVVNKEKNKMLAVYHKIADGWTYPGGHADGDDNLLEVAIREVYEETGIRGKAVNNVPFMIATLPVYCHVKNNQFISSHLHFDVIYLMEADEALPLNLTDDAIFGIKWISFEDVFNENFCCYIKPIVIKMIDKINNQC